MHILSLLITPRHDPEDLMRGLRQSLAADVALAADGRIAAAMEVDPSLDAQAISDAIGADDGVARVELVAAWYEDDNDTGLDQLKPASSIPGASHHD